MTSPSSDFRPESPFRVHLRVVFALLRREMSTRYGRKAGGYIWAIVEPCGMIFVMSFVFDLMSRSPDLGRSFIVFFATGFLSFNFFRNTSGYISGSIKQNKALIKYPNVNIFDSLVARFVLQTLTNCLIAMLILSVAIWATGERVRIDFTHIFPALAASSAIGLGAGACNSVLFVMFPTWEQFYNIITRPLFLISGILYTPESLPQDVQDLLSWNPLVHVVANFREGFYPAYTAEVDNLAYPTLFGMVLFFAALLLLRRYDERLAEQ